MSGNGESFEREFAMGQRRETIQRASVALVATDVMTAYCQRASFAASLSRVGSGGNGRSVGEL
jgi:hypothetical protein